MLSESVIKKIFQIFNHLFVCTGVLFILAGIGVNSTFNKYTPFLEERYFSLTILFIFCGCFTFIIAGFGYFGIFKRNVCVIFTYCGVLILLFILALTAGTLGFILHDQSNWLVDYELKDTMDNYLNGDREIQRAWDKLHEEFYCCGSYGLDDWADLIEKKFNRTELPLSCCNKIQKIKYANCTYTYNYNRYRRIYSYEKVRNYGCHDLLGSYVGEHAYALGIIAYIFAVIHFVGILLAVMFAHRVKNPYPVKNN